MQERTTKQKEFIKEYLKNSYIHPTAFDVLKSAKENNINIGLTSIYRILNKMVEKQEAFSIITKDNIVHYDTNRGDHYHFICTSCNKIIDIDYDIEDNNLNFRDLKYARNIQKNMILLIVFILVIYLQIILVLVVNMFTI